MSQLTPKQQAFINAYLICWNATEAALEAGYAKRSAYSIGHENLKKPEIQNEIQARIDDLVMSANEALISLSDIARGDMSDFFKVIGNVPVIDFTKAQQTGKLHLLKKLTFDKGKISFELYDKQAALNTIAKHHGLLNEKIEIDVNLIVQVVDALQSLGQDPAAVFNEIIARAKVKQDAGS